MEENSLTEDDLKYILSYIAFPLKLETFKEIIIEILKDVIEVPFILLLEKALRRSENQLDFTYELIKTFNKYYNTRDIISVEYWVWRGGVLSLEFGGGGGGDKRIFGKLEINFIQHLKNRCYTKCVHLFFYFLGFLTSACAAASLAIGTLNGEHDT